jgi:hypothetical protein
MIRTAYYVPPMQQFRARVELAARRTRRALEQRRRALRSSGSPARSGMVLDNDYLGLRWRQDLVRTRAAYEEFFDKYDTLVGLLCLAAHEGLKPEHEDEYRELRAWFQEQYPSVKPRIASHLAPDDSDTAPGLWGRRPCDAFEAMYLPATVAVLLENDGGSLIGRMMRAQAALDAWDRSLRREEAAVLIPAAR